MPPIWQLGGSLVEPFTQRHEVVVELAVVEGASLDRDCLGTLPYSSRQVKERRKTFPCGVRIGARKILVAGPQHHIHQRDQTSGHNLIFAIVSCIHLPFLGSQILQCPQHLTRLSKVSFLLAPILILPGLDPVDALPQPLQFGINRGFAFLDQGVRPKALVQI